MNCILFAGPLGLFLGYLIAKATTRPCDKPPSFDVAPLDRVWRLESKVQCIREDLNNLFKRDLKGKRKANPSDLKKGMVIHEWVDGHGLIEMEVFNVTPDCEAVYVIGSYDRYNRCVSIHDGNLYVDDKPTKRK